MYWARDLVRLGHITSVFYTLNCTTRVCDDLQSHLNFNLSAASLTLGMVSSSQRFYGIPVQALRAVTRQTFHDLCLFVFIWHLRRIHRGDKDIYSRVCCIMLEKDSRFNKVLLISRVPFGAESWNILVKIQTSVQSVSWAPNGSGPNSGLLIVHKGEVFKSSKSEVLPYKILL